MVTTRSQLRHKRRERSRHLKGIVPDPAAVHDLEPCLLRERHDHRAVRVVDGGIVQGGAGLPEFVPGRDDADPRASPNAHASRVPGREKGDMASVEALAGSEEKLALRDVFAPSPDVVSGPKHAAQDEVVAIAPSVLLHQHGVRRGGQRRAGEDARRGAFRERAGLVAGGDAALERQAGAGGQHAAAKRDRVAVHRGLVEQRHGEPRDDLFRKRATSGLAKRAPRPRR